MNLTEIQSWWEVPSIAYFCSLFKNLFKLPEFDIEDLEEAILGDTAYTVERNNWLPQLIISLLIGLDGRIRNSITEANYQSYLSPILSRRCQAIKWTNPLEEETDFESLNMYTKITILQYLCEFRMHKCGGNRVSHAFYAERLRIEPLGYGRSNSIYWYFCDTRLYREDLAKKGQKKNTWKIVCFSKEDWKKQANIFKYSTNENERALYDVLVKNILPNISSLFCAREEKRRLKLLKIQESDKENQIEAFVGRALRHSKR